MIVTTAIKPFFLVPRNLITTPRIPSQNQTSTPTSLSDLYGILRVHATVANPLKRNLKTELEFIADTGAIHTVIPETIAKELQLQTTDKRRFKIASGEIVEYPISEAYITLEDKSVTSLVAIATEKTPKLLGVTTLELLGLTVDQVTGKLTPLELTIL